MRVVTNLRQMATRLAGRGYPNLTIERVVFAGEHHQKVVSAAMSRGLMSHLALAGGR